MNINKELSDILQLTDKTNKNRLYIARELLSYVYKHNLKDGKYVILNNSKESLNLKSLIPKIDEININNELKMDYSTFQKYIFDNNINGGITNNTLIEYF